MRRLGYFWSGLPLTSKLQFLVMGIILGTLFATKDLNPKNHVLGVPLWKITASMIFGTFVLGRILLPVMLWHPTRTQRVLSLCGIMVFGVGLLIATLPLRRLLITHLSITLALWLDVSCWFWFISEIQWRASRLMAQAAGQVDQAAGTTGDSQLNVDTDEDKGSGR